MKSFTMIFVAVAFFVSLYFWGYSFYQEREYQRNTSSIVKAGHDKNLEILKELHRGDLIELLNGEILTFISYYGSLNSSRAIVNYGRSEGNASAIYIARNMKTIHRIGDPTWCEAAEKYLTR